MSRLGAILLVCGAAFVALVGPAAGATVVCGKPDPATHAPAQATLSLQQDSRTDITFKLHKGVRHWVLRFTVAGCSLDQAVPKPTLTVLPQSSAELPKEAVSPDDALAKGSELTLTVNVNAGKFDPGSYKVLLLAQAPYLKPTSTPVSVSRSYDRVWIPVLIAAIAGLLGLAWAVIGVLKAATGSVTVRLPWLLVCLFVGVIVGVLTLKVTYLGQDGWTLEDNALGTAGAAFAAGSSGSVAGLLPMALYYRAARRRQNRAD